MAAFVDAIDAINRLAEESPGFVWRGKGVVGHSALLERGCGELLVSLWEDHAGFHNVTYRSAHGRYLTARDHWFVRLPGPTTALWWTAVDDRPDVDSALARLRQLRREGPSLKVFTALRQWGPDGRPLQRHNDPLGSHH